MRLRFLTLIFVLGLLGAVATLAWTILRSGRALPPKGVTVVVREGAGVAEIAQRLEAAGVVQSALVFRLWARLAGRDRSIQPGTYHFENATDMSGVLTRLAAGVEPLEVTIPEGLTVREIADLLATRGLGSAESFRCLASDPAFLLAAGVPGPQLEGFLFPDTYRFLPPEEPSEVLGTMVRRFHDRFDAEHHRRAHERHLTVNEVLTLASIIEKETGKASERPLIAAVFANRLRIGMPLQSDPTVIYSLPAFDGNLTRADLANPSPYNTYVARGLPPGPIANPGLAAIDAALAPADSPALYFVSRNDGSHEFSTTLAEHNRAVTRFQRSGR
ncbi:MAG: endolytic transglycosylase MltG [Candidatus Binatia bacterium]